jgi:polysaccharide biosynthesis/export protein
MDSPMRPSRIVIVLIAALAVAGCVRKSPRVVAAAPPGPPVAHVVPVAAPAPVVTFDVAPYTLDSGDKLRVVVFGQEGLTNTYSVDPGGAITMPLIGRVPARGLSTTSLAQSIAGRLRQGYIREPHVAVEIETYRPFFILGEVLNPGQYSYVANMTVETAVAIAGGFSPRAYKHKAKLTRVIEGVQVRGQVPLAYPVRPGDTISIPERWF